MLRPTKPRWPNPQTSTVPSAIFQDARLGWKIPYHSRFKFVPDWWPLTELPVDYLMVEGTELVYSNMEELPECPYYQKIKSQS